MKIELKIMKSKGIYAKIKENHEKWRKMEENHEKSRKSKEKGREITSKINRKSSKHE